MPPSGHRLNAEMGATTKEKSTGGLPQIPLYFEDPGQCKRPRTFLRTIAKIAMAVGTLLFNIALFPKIISSPFKLFQVPRINRPRRNQYDFCPREVMSLIDQTTPHQPRSVKDALCDWIPRKC